MSLVHHEKGSRLDERASEKNVRQEEVNSGKRNKEVFRYSGR